MGHDNFHGGEPNDRSRAGALQPPGHRLDDAPALTLARLMQAVGQANSNAAHNATNALQQSFVTSEAATTMGVSTLYAVDSDSTAVATAAVAKS